jgi:HK97 family phage prohead protease
MSAAKVRKQLTAKVTKQGTGDNGRTQATFTASTASLDRDGDRINPSGWKLDAYKANPVVLWGHDHSSHPVGRAVEVAAIGDSLRVVIEFPPENVSPEGYRVGQLVEAGFLSAVSVGFLPLDYAPNGQGGHDFESVELLEISIVTVPANPEALIAAGFDNATVKWYGKNSPADPEVSDNEVVKQILNALSDDPEVSDDEVARQLAEALAGEDDPEVSDAEVTRRILEALTGDDDPEISNEEVVEAIIEAVHGSEV